MIRAFRPFFHAFKPLRFSHRIVTHFRYISERLFVYS